MRHELKKREQLQRSYERTYFPKVSRAIGSSISSLIEVIKTRGVSAGVSYASQQVDSGSLPRVIEDLYQTVGLRFARMQWSSLQQQLSKHNGHDYQTKGFGFNEEWVSFIKDYLYRFLLEKITYQVSAYTRQVLLGVLNKSIEEGWGIEETVRALKELPLSRTQAARIVRTEITRASNTGTMAAASTFEFEQSKEWIAAMDSRTRGTDPEDHASHRGLDGKVVDYEGFFTDPRNGDRLRFPGDPGGQGLPATKAESTINCRCTIAVVAKIGDDGRLIPKNKLQTAKSEKSEEMPQVIKTDNITILQTTEIENRVDSMGNTVKGLGDTVKELDSTVKDLVSFVNIAKHNNAGVVEQVKEVLLHEINKKGKKIDDVIEVVKAYNPVIHVDADEFKASVDTLRMEQSRVWEALKMELINVLAELKRTMDKPKTWVFDIERNGAELITKITAKQK